MPKATDARADLVAPDAAPALATLFHAATTQGLAFAAWRLPHADNWQVVISLQETHAVRQPVLENSEFGFLLCPFKADEQHSNHFIKADIHASSGMPGINFAENAPQQAVQRFQEQLALQQQPEAIGWPTPTDQALATEQPEAAYKNAVKKAVAAILAEEMEKVVLSRTLKLPIPDGFSPVAAFEMMLGLHPRALVSLVAVPGLGTWIGASPEILVSVDEKQVFRTVALAGTQPITNATSTANAIWRQKEIEEQALVERYVINCFKKIRLRDYTEIGPKTIIAGNLMHLRTDFKVDMKLEPDFPNLGTDMLQLLHPTSAVCGMPKEPALHFILEQEGYDRSYYSGYLGPVGSTEGTQLYVNLRCMQLLETDAILYAGAGITGESSPEKEWLETQYKLQAMRRVLGGLSLNE